MLQERPRSPIASPPSTSDRRAELAWKMDCWQAMLEREQELIRHRRQVDPQLMDRYRWASREYQLDRQITLWWQRLVLDDPKRPRRSDALPTQVDGREWQSTSPSHCLRSHDEQRAQHSYYDPARDAYSSRHGLQELNTCLGRQEHPVGGARHHETRATHLPPRQRRRVTERCTKPTLPSPRPHHMRLLSPLHLPWPAAQHTLVPPDYAFTPAYSLPRHGRDTAERADLRHFECVPGAFSSARLFLDAVFSQTRNVLADREHGSFARAMPRIFISPELAPSDDSVVTDAPKPRRIAPLLIPWLNEPDRLSPKVADRIASLCITQLIRSRQGHALLTPASLSRPKRRSEEQAPHPQVTRLLGPFLSSVLITRLRSLASVSSPMRTTPNPQTTPSS